MTDVISIRDDFCKADGNDLRFAFPSREAKGSFATCNAAYTR